MLLIFTTQLLIRDMEKKYSGVVVPMITPFTDKYKIDLEAAERITNHLILHDAHPFVLGTTGESVSICPQERKKFLQATVHATKKRKTVYAGISGNCLSSVLEEARAFSDLGADVLVSTMPSYYPVDEDQMLRYFQELADAVPLPLIVYNIPSTTHLSIPLSVADKLSHHQNIVGFKDSEKGEQRVEEAIKLWKDREDFSYLLGWALMSHKAMAWGADGMVPSTGNLTPGLYRIIYESGRAQQADRSGAAQDKADRISSIYQKDKILSRSLPVLKIMMDAYGLCGTSVLPPLYKISAQEEETIKELLLTEYGSLDSINNI